MFKKTTSKVRVITMVRTKRKQKLATKISGSVCDKVTTNLNIDNLSCSVNLNQNTISRVQVHNFATSKTKRFLLQTKLQSIPSTAALAS